MSPADLKQVVQIPRISYHIPVRKCVPLTRPLGPSQYRKILQYFIYDTTLAHIQKKTAALLDDIKMYARESTGYKKTVSAILRIPIQHKPFLDPQKSKFSWYKYQSLTL